MKLYLFIFTIILFTGCVSKEEFPNSWEKIETKSSLECVDISGKYSNKGKKEQSNYSPFLSEYLFLESKSADSIEFNMSKNSLNIKTFLNDKIILTKTLFKNEKSLICKNGFWLIKKDENHNREGVLAKEWDNFYLSKNKDGLVVRKENSAVGLFFLVPVVGYDSSWILFKNLK